MSGLWVAFIVWSVVVALPCAYWAQRITARKKYPTPFWFLFAASIILGPLCPLLMYAVRERRLTHKFCPYCQFLIPVNAIVCGHCGSALVAPPDAPRVIDITPDRQAHG